MATHGLIVRRVARVTFSSLCVRDGLCRGAGARRALSQANARGPTDFGFNQVPYEDKEHMVRNIFSSVAQKYDLMNDLMSAGVHRLWKDEFVRMLGIQHMAAVQPREAAELRFLDVAGGTGDIAFRILGELRTHTNLSRPRTTLMLRVRLWPAQLGPEANQSTSPKLHSERNVVVADINVEMLKVGRERCSARFPPQAQECIGFVEANAESLPFPDDSFDVYTIAFGLRNKQAAIREAHRVLRQGGRFMCLEFSHVSNFVLRQLYDTYSFKVIPALGRAVTNDAEAYRYLVESIRMFPAQEVLRDIVSATGFAGSSYTNFSCGVCAVHCGWKL